MRNWRRTAAVMALLLFLLAAGSGCAGRETVPQGPEQSYTKWIKIADGVWNSFHMPEYMDAKGVFLQKTGYEEPEQISFVDIEDDSVSLVSSGFDLNAEIQRAKKLIQEGQRDLTGMVYQYLPKRNALVIQVNSPELFLYHIESGELELLGDGGYTGTPYAEVYNLALQKLGDEAFVYSYSGVRPSADERWLAFESTVAQVSGETGQEVYLYDMKEKTERLLLTGASPEENWLVRGWTGNDELLCIREIVKLEDGIRTGTEEQTAFLVKTDGTLTELDLLEGVDPQAPFSLYVDSGVIIAEDNGEPASIRVYLSEGRGELAEAIHYEAGSSRIIDHAAVNPARTRMVYLNAPQADSPARELRVVSLAGEEERAIAGVDIGEGIETSIAGYEWIDSDRLLIRLREVWSEQTTFSAWILDLRGGDAALENDEGDAGEGEEEGEAAEAARPSGAPLLERDQARPQDRAEVRDEKTMAAAYMTLIGHICQAASEMGPPDSQLELIALDTSDMLWLTQPQKSALLSMMAERWPGAEIVEKTWTQLKEEGRLDEEDNLSQGMLLKISGGWFQNNIMQADVMKWHSGEEQLTLSGVQVEFQEDSWGIL